MEFQRLSNDELELMEQIEGGGPLSKLSKSGTLVSRLNSALKEANLAYKRTYNKNDSNPPYEVTGPVTLPCHVKKGGGVSKTNISMIGMEKLKFVRLAATTQGNIIGIFNSPEYPDTDIMVRYEKMDEIFGKRASQLKSWLEFVGKVSERRDEILNSEKNKVTSGNYGEVKSYGSW